MNRITVHDKNSLPTALTSTITIGGLATGDGNEASSIPKVSPQCTVCSLYSSALIFCLALVVSDATFNAQLVKPININAIDTPLNVELLPQPYDNPRRYMHIRPADKAAALNAQIDRYAHLYAAALGMKFEDLGNPGIMSPSPRTVVGRIVVSNASDATGSAEERLTEGKIVLESSRQMGSGCRVPLEVDGKMTCAFFPGQIVALEGVNPDGRAFHVAAQKSVSK